MSYTRESLYMEKKVYAPMLIPTLCRDQHFMRCIESLKKNTWAKYTMSILGLIIRLTKNIEMDILKFANI